MKTWKVTVIALSLCWLMTAFAVNPPELVMGVGSVSHTPAGNCTNGAQVTFTATPTPSTATNWSSLPTWTATDGSFPNTNPGLTAIWQSPSGRGGIAVITATKGSSSATNEITFVAVQSVSHSTNLYCGAGDQVTFTAGPSPSGATFPSGSPAWTASDGSFQGNNSGASIVWQAPTGRGGSATITAICGLPLVSTSITFVAVASLDGATGSVVAGTSLLYTATSDPAGHEDLISWEVNGQVMAVHVGSYTLVATPGDYKVEAFYGSSIKSVDVTGVQVKELQYQLGTNWPTMPATVYCKDGEAFNFRVQPDPTNAAWPAGKPAWSMSVTQNVANVAEASGTFSAPGTYTVSAECGNTKSGNVTPLKITVTPDTTNILARGGVAEFGLTNTVLGPGREAWRIDPTNGVNFTTGSGWAKVTPDDTTGAVYTVTAWCVDNTDVSDEAIVNVFKIEIKDGEDDTQAPGQFVGVGNTLQFQAKIMPPSDGEYKWRITRGKKNADIEGVDDDKKVTVKGLEASRNENDVTTIKLRFKPTGAINWLSPVFHDFNVLDVNITPGSTNIAASGGVAVFGLTNSYVGPGGLAWSSSSTNGITWDVSMDTKRLTVTPDGTTGKTYTITARCLDDTNITDYAVLNAYKIDSIAVATNPLDRTRTIIGVAEDVDLYIHPAIATSVWTVSSNGSLSMPVGDHTLLTAPINSNNICTVTMTFGNFSCSKTFNVREPTTVISAPIYTVFHYPIGNGAAGMWLRPVVGPLNVCLSKVAIYEGVADATNRTGYFAARPPINHDAAAGANFAISLNQQNEWHANYDKAELYDQTPPWTNGSFSWKIPATWAVDPSIINTMKYGGWIQSFSIDSTGTVTVTKFGHWVTRTTNDVINAQ